MTGGLGKGHGVLTQQKKVASSQSDAVSDVRMASLLFF